MTLHDFARTHRVAVSRNDRTSDGDGGWIVEPAVVGEVTGSLQPGGAVEMEVADAERAEVRWQFLADEGTDIRRDDELEVVAVRTTAGWLPVAAGRRFRVVADGEWVDLTAGLSHLAVQLEELQRGR